VAISCFCDHCGAANAPSDTVCCACQKPLTLPAETTGTLLNERYEILNEIGAGGFGAVYKARDTREGRRLVAVKQINLQGLSPQEIIEATDAFNREAEILTMLSHPLLPTIFDRFSDPEHWYLVMTYIDGTTLDEYLQHHHASGLHTTPGLPLRETLEIALRLCDALHHLHTQQPPVIFRDLKPGNIMRTRKGQLYLIDFGIARRFKPGQAKDTIPFGSPGFAAPEQYGRAQTTPQADIYSLGALLYCLLTGDDPSEHPFDFAPLPYPTIEGMRELNALIQRMVAIDPLQRPADILEVQADLKGIQQLNAWSNQQHRLWTPPQSQTPPPAGSGQQQVFLNSTGNTKPQKHKISRRAAIITSLIVGSVALSIGIPTLTIWQSEQMNNQMSASNPYQDQNSSDQQAWSDPGEATATAIDQHPAMPLSGPIYWSSDLTYAAITNLMQNQTELYKVQGQQLLHIIKNPANFSAPTIWWSLDNNKILAQSDTGMIYAWSITNDQPLFTFTSAIAGYTGNFPENSFPTAVSWSPNGAYCAMSYRNGTGNTAFAVVHTNGGKQIFQAVLPYSDGNAVTEIAWSPDSQYFVLPDSSAWTAGMSWSASVWKSATAQKVGSFGGMLPHGTQAQNILLLAWSPDGKEIATVINNSLWISQIESSKAATVAEDVYYDSSINGQIWSPNGRYIVFPNLDSTSVYDTSNWGADVPFNNGQSEPELNIVAFAWSPDSRSINIVDDHNSISNWPVG
jgi:eukaryotic-like serine/threonine-protein kinase